MTNESNTCPQIKGLWPHTYDSLNDCTTTRREWHRLGGIAKGKVDAVVAHCLVKGQPAKGTGMYERWPFCIG